MSWLDGKPYICSVCGQQDAGYGHLCAAQEAVLAENVCLCGGQIPADTAVPRSAVGLDITLELEPGHSFPVTINGIPYVPQQAASGVMCDVCNMPMEAHGPALEHPPAFEAGREFERKQAAEVTVEEALRFANKLSKLESDGVKAIYVGQFLRRAVSAEREACAKIAEEEWTSHVLAGQFESRIILITTNIAAKIRARGGE